MQFFLYKVIKLVTQTIMKTKKRLLYTDIGGRWASYDNH